MISRQTFSAPFAALLLLGVTAGAANAATQDKMHAASHARSGHMHTKSTMSRGSSSQDHMADRLNAQSLQRANGGAMQQPGMAQPGMAQPGMAPAQGTAQ